MSLMEAKYPQHPGVMAQSKRGSHGARCSKTWATASFSRTSLPIAVAQWCVLSRCCLGSTRGQGHSMPYTSGALRSPPLGRNEVSHTRCGCWLDRMERLEQKQEKLLATKSRMYNVRIHTEAIKKHYDKPFACSPTCVLGTNDTL